jgi:lipopolysaccharide heptosyltransferase II
LKILVIQTAFLGDVILATSVAEKLHEHFPEASISFLVRKGNESLFNSHPFIHQVHVWDKMKNKTGNLLKVISAIRKEMYDYVINLHRFTSSGFITSLSGAKVKIGFDKNPLSFFFTKKFRHDIDNGKHETERNHQLIKNLTDEVPAKPKLYPTTADFETIAKIRNQFSDNHAPYICIAPASVWFTKQFPKEKWIELINRLPNNIAIFLIGSKADFNLCESIKSNVTTNHKNVFNLAGQLTYLESAALMKNASMNFVNDSAPLHIASAMNAPVTAIFCSTIPAFGFGPLSDNSKIIETNIKLDCKPCGLHGYNSCPLGHFKCALTIDINDLISDK